MSSKKTVVSVEIPCWKCRQQVMKSISTVNGITSIALDPLKNTVTVIGEADPVKVIKKVRRFKKSAAILSVGPEKEEKKDDGNKSTEKKSESKDVMCHFPKICPKCDVWYVITEDASSYCSIM